MNGDFPSDEGGMRHYNVQHVPTGFSLMFGAGALSGLLGIGSGAVKVLAMDQAMKIPFKVSTTTSNFMIGVTAAASAGVYLNRGYVDPGLAILYMSGYKEEHLARFGPLLQNCRMLSKPFTPQELVRAIYECMGGPPTSRSAGS